MAFVTGKVVQFEHFGGPEVLETAALELDEPGPGEVLVAIEAAGVNPVDWKIRGGWRSNGQPLAHASRMGIDASGTVLAVGPGVSGFDAGDDVIGFDLPWGYATHVLASAERFTPKPSAVSFEEGAAIGVPVGTAYQVLKTMRLAPGETLLVHAGAGAVGQAAIQLGKRWGARVIATAGESNHQRLRDLGAEPIAYGDGLADRIKALAPDGVDVVIEGAGTTEAIEASLAMAHDPKRIAEIVIRQWREEYGVSAFSASAPGYLSTEDLRLRVEAMPFAANLAAQGELVLEINSRYPLDRASDAQREGEGGHAHGKIVLLTGATA